MSEQSCKRDPCANWSWSQERVFLEEIICQRFNFLLVFYSLVVVGAFTTQSSLNFSLAFTLGALITSLIAVPIARVQRRLDCVLEEIESLYPDHPAVRTDKLVHEGSRLPPLFRRMARKSRREWIGYGIPTLCAASLCVGAGLAWFGVIGPHG